MYQILKYHFSCRNKDTPVPNDLLSSSDSESETELEGTGRQVGSLRLDSEDGNFLPNYTLRMRKVMPLQTLTSSTFVPNVKTFNLTFSENFSNMAEASTSKQ